MRGFTFILIFTFPGFSSFSQDVIVKTTGEEIDCKITKIDSITIYLTMRSRGQVINTYINKSEVKQISTGKINSDFSSSADVTADTNNTLTFNLTSLVKQTLSISFYRIIKPNLELVINPSFGIGSSKDPLYGYLSTVTDLFWFYNRFTLQGGFCFHKKNKFYESTIFYEYGYFTNKSLMIEDNDGDQDDEFWKLDRNYHSIGCMWRSGNCTNRGTIRNTIYVGIAPSLRFYTENIHLKYYWHPEFDTYYTNPDNKLTHYLKPCLAFKIGIEWGGKL
jgi:hypothetical protein